MDESERKLTLFEMLSALSLSAGAQDRMSAHNANIANILFKLKEENVYLGISILPDPK